MKPKFTDADRYPHGYTPAAATDITKTLDRARKRVEAERVQTAEVVRPLKQERKP